MPTQRGALLLDLPSVATMPFYHSVGGHPHVLDQALAAGYQVHNISRFASEPIPHFVFSACECAGECPAFFHSWAGLTFPAPNRMCVLI